MSKALVLILADGTAIKWAGKYHNHLAFVDPTNGRIKEYLPVRIRPNNLNALFFVEVGGERAYPGTTFSSHREALFNIAQFGLRISDELTIGGEEIAERDWAEDMYLTHLQALPKARGANAGVAA